jgi:hypothetical protein
MRPIVLLCAAATAALAGCAHAPPVTQSQPPSAPTRSCAAPEYVTRGPHDGVVTMDVEVNEAGHALRVEKTAASGLTDVEIGNALFAVKRAFHCRTPLPHDAPRVISGYQFRYVAKMQGAGVDPEVCGRAAPYPASALRFGAQRRVVLGVTLDERGAVEDAWPIDAVDPYGFTQSGINALLHGCHFTPARLHGRPVPFFLVYRFAFVIPRSEQSPL